MRKYQLRNSTQLANGDNLNRDNRDTDTNSDTDTDRDTDTIRDRNRENIKDNRVSDYAYQLKLIPAFGYWIRQQWNNGWDVYFFTFVFQQLPGSRNAKVDQMFQEITRVYGRLATRTVRKPRSPQWASILPRGVFVADRPISKDRGCKQKLRHVLPNDGLHVHGLVAAKRLGRIREPLDQHFRDDMDEYLIGKIDEIDVVPITDNPSYATQYGAKGLKRRTFSSDDILILPKTLDEFANKTPQALDPIRDIQAATNVSDELANEIFRNPTLFQSLVGKR
jgi:hypothetical protein